MTVDWKKKLLPNLPYLLFVYLFDNETPALNALKALRGAPISMGRGEIPVELRPAAVRFLPLLWF